MLFIPLVIIGFIVIMMVIMITKNFRERKAEHLSTAPLLIKKFPPGMTKQGSVYTLDGAKNPKLFRRAMAVRITFLIFSIIVFVLILIRTLTKL